MRSKLAPAPGAANGAFTLVELLVVITIILLLAGILVPTVASALKMGHKASCVARIGELNDGCAQYHNDAKYYPGQQNLNWVGTNSGAQVLAKAMFTKDNRWPTSNYASYKETDLLTASDQEVYANTIWDRFPRDKMPIIYYPSRIGESGRTQYHMEDNEAITGRWSGFHSFILDNRFGASNMPHRSGEFLIMAAGPDREFADDENLVNWNR